MEKTEQNKAAIEELKTAIKETVALKQKNTSERVEYARESKGKVDVYQRASIIAGYWSESRILKEQLRYLQLAYAFWRGRRYWQAERFTKDPPSSYALSNVARANEADIKAWLAAPVTDEEKAAWAEHVERSKAKAREAKAAANAKRTAA